MVFTMGGVVGLISALGVIGLAVDALGRPFEGAPIPFSLFSLICVTALPIGLGVAAVAHSRREETREAIQGYFASDKCWFCRYDLAGVPVVDAAKTCPECGETKFLLPDSKWTGQQPDQQCAPKASEDRLNS